MPAAENRFKSALSRGQLQIGSWVGMADPYLAEITATAGFDWLLVDGEHAPNDLRTIMEQVRVIQASDSHPVVRLPVGETWMIKQVLDAGAQSILIPLVESAEQARDLARAVQYPPNGVRGVGAALARSSRFSGIPDYLATADAQIWLGVQVETRAGLAALDDILGVGRVDGVFVGPADLAADMGYLGRYDVAEVNDLILDALGRIAAAGKAPGILTTDPAFAATCRRAGARFVATTIDVTLYAQAIRQAAQQSRDNLADQT
ncbi:aldolase/citrate lyase family protein [Paracoccus pacificus]|uniref:Aldolase/citrate lyase family protein n=1 Tax=Paracoccus pacificus TaxID=1463598 RepID=A0ABW4R9N7_9RHOB